MPVPIGIMVLGLRENVWAKDTHLKVVSTRWAKAIKWKGVTNQENVGKEGKQTQDRSWGTTSFRGQIEEEKANLKDTLRQREELGIIRISFYSFSSLPVQTMPSVELFIPYSLNKIKDDFVTFLGTLK